MAWESLLPVAEVQKPAITESQVMIWLALRMFWWCISIKYKRITMCGCSLPCTIGTRDEEEWCLCPQGRSLQAIQRVDVMYCAHSCIHFTIDVLVDGDVRFTWPE
jgi:hypothetical protein